MYGHDMNEVNGAPEGVSLDRHAGGMTQPGERPEGAGNPLYGHDMNEVNGAPEGVSLDRHAGGMTQPGERPEGAGNPLYGHDMNEVNGAPEGIRTPGLCLRRAALYPAELRALDSDRSRVSPGGTDGFGGGGGRNRGADRLPGSRDTVHRRPRILPSRISDVYGG